VPFLFQPPPCPDCNKTFERSERIYTNHLIGGDKVNCPACGKHELLHFPSSVLLYYGAPKEFLLPSKGEIVHGQLNARCPEALCIPGIWVIKMRLCNETWESIPLGLLKFIVNEVTLEELTLFYVGLLSNEEGWDEYLAPKWYIDQAGS